MKVLYYDIANSLDIHDRLCACIGYFDGLHKGHQALVDRCKQKSQELGSKSALITFYPDPKDIISGIKHQHIQPFKQRLEIIEKFDLDYCIVIKFDDELCHMQRKTFIENIFDSFDLKCLVCGFDFRYAYKGSGNIDTLKEDASGKFMVEVIDAITYLDDKISTTRIKKEMIDGHIQLVNQLLGYDYFIKSNVIKGKQIGRSIGFPTANLYIHEEIMIPKDGVYIGYCKVFDNVYKAMINVGDNPTIADDNHKTIEVHILDFDQDIYDEEIVVYFNKRIRDCVRFENIDELKKQLSIDIMKAGEQDGRKQFIL